MNNYLILCKIGKIEVTQLMHRIACIEDLMMIKDEIIKDIAYEHLVEPEMVEIISIEEI